MDSADKSREFDGLFLRVNPALVKTFGFESTQDLLHHPGGVSSLYKNVKDSNQSPMPKIQLKVRNQEFDLTKLFIEKLQFSKKSKI